MKDNMNFFDFAAEGFMTPFNGFVCALAFLNSLWISFRELLLIRVIAVPNTSFLATVIMIAR